VDLVVWKKMKVRVRVKERLTIKPYMIY